MVIKNIKIGRGLSLNILEEKAIKFARTIAKAYPNEKLYAGNSGGKDSAVVDKLLQKSGIKYFLCNTTMTLLEQCYKRKLPISVISTKRNILPIS